GMGVGRCEDVDHVGPFGHETFVEGPIGRSAAERGGSAPRGVGVEIAEDERRVVVEKAHGGSVRLGDAATAHHGDLHAGVSARRGAYGERRFGGTEPKRQRNPPLSSPAQRTISGSGASPGSPRPAGPVTSTRNPLRTISRPRKAPVRSDG